MHISCHNKITFLFILKRNIYAKKEAVKLTASRKNFLKVEKHINCAIKTVNTKNNIVNTVTVSFCYNS